MDARNRRFPALICIALFVFSVDNVVSIHAFRTGRSFSSWRGDLGVIKVQGLLAQIPSQNSSVSRTAILSVWLRRVRGGGHGSLPMKPRDTIRALVWADDPEDLHRRKFGHVALPLEPPTWQPRLLLETTEPGPILKAAWESGPQVLKLFNDGALRPYSFRFDLPRGSEDWICFKLLEATFPTDKVPVCVPPEAEGGRRGVGDSGISSRPGPESQLSVCASLAPPEAFSAFEPALWAVIGPIRESTSTRNWQAHYSQAAVRLANYMSYHLAMGVTGLLLYADRLSRFYLRQQAAIDPYLRTGRLRFIAWDLPERAHKLTEEEVRKLPADQARPLGYNYDQALVASHVLLGLSACDTNLMLLVADLDEFLYTPHPNLRWPDLMRTCLDRTKPASYVFWLQRYDVLSSTVPPKKELFLWTNKTLLTDYSSSDGQAVAWGGGRAASGSTYSDALYSQLRPEAFLNHPLARYDRRASRPIQSGHNKMLGLPTAEVVAFFVHEGHPRFGQAQIANPACISLLHVANYWGERTTNAAVYAFNGTGAVPFKNPFFDVPGYSRGTP